MASRIGYTSLSASTLSASATFVSLADDGNASGGIIEASDNGQMYGDWILQASFTAAPSGGVSLYFVTSHGNLTVDGNGSTDPPPNALVGVFSMRQVTGVQRVPISFLQIPNRDFFPVYINETGVSMGAGSNAAYYELYDINPDA